MLTIINNHDKNVLLIYGGIDQKELSALYNEINSRENDHFDNYLIAYIDFLGMKKKISESNGYEEMLLLKSIYDKAKQRAGKIKDINNVDDFKFKMFSDNIIIAQKIDDNNLDAQLFSMINLVALMQCEALFQHYIALRGGITIGELYIDNTIVWGKGLVRAYNIENFLAVYPRVVLDSSIIERCKELQQKNDIKCDKDGLWYVNYYSVTPFTFDIPNLSASLKDYIHFSRYIDDDKVKQKLNWIINSFNSHCHEHEDDGDYEKYTILLLP